MNYLDRIDGDLLGLRGLTGSLDGLFILLIIPVSLVVSVVSPHIDEQRLDSALDVAVNPLSVLLGLGGLFLIAKLAGLNVAGRDGTDESITNRIATLVAGVSGATLFTIIVHRLLPEGDLTNMLGATILILVLFCFVMLVAGTAMFHATQLCLLGFRGLTLGHMLAGVRVVDSRTGEPIGWKQSALRTSVPVACLFIFLLFELSYPLGMDADVNGAKYIALITASAIVLAVSLASFMSYWLLREIHAHGQGLLDLMSRTVTVALKGEPAETIPQSTTPSREPEGADSR